MTKEEFDRRLRNYLTRKLKRTGCDGTFHWTERWLRWRRVQRPQYKLEYFMSRGATCDCEVLLNVVLH